MTEKGEGQPERPERCGQCAAWEPANPDPVRAQETLRESGVWSGREEAIHLGGNKDE